MFINCSGLNFGKKNQFSVVWNWLSDGSKAKINLLVNEVGKMSWPNITGEWRKYFQQIWISSHSHILHFFTFLDNFEVGNEKIVILEIFALHPYVFFFCKSWTKMRSFNWLMDRTKSTLDKMALIMCYLGLNNDSIRIRHQKSRRWHIYLMSKMSINWPWLWVTPFWVD